MTGRAAHISPDDFVARPGDIFACWGTDLVSRGISFETSLLSWITGPSGLRWSPSHVAIACPRLDLDHPERTTSYWFESTTLATRICLSAGTPVSGVQVHRVRDRMRDYLFAGGCVAVYRLTQIDALRTDEQARLWQMLDTYVGREDRAAIGYDTGGAIFSGSRLLKYLPFSRSDLQTMFCSELIAAVLQRLCRLNRENPAKFHPGLLLRRLVRQGTYGHHCTFEGSRHG